MSLLSPRQYGELHAALIASYGQPNAQAGLETLFRFNYVHGLASRIDWRQSLSRVATEILDLLQQLQDAGPLVRGLLRDRPRVPEVVRFCELYPEIVAAVASPERLVADATGALSAPAFLHLARGVDMDPLRDELRAVGGQIRSVAAYKALHDSLHNLEKWFPVIKDYSGKLGDGPAAAALLGRTVNDLRAEARLSREAAGEVSLSARELDWIKGLDWAAERMDRALRTRDPALLAGAVAAIEATLGESERINIELCHVAEGLSMDELIAALTGADTPPFRAGREGLKGLRAGFARLVAEHREWQWLDRHLRAIDSSRETAPDRKVPLWGLVSERLGRLCGLFPAEEWSVGLMASREQWERAAAAAEAGADGLALDFRFAGLGRFIEVDRQLKLLCGRLKEIATVLNTLVEVLADAHA